jgi:hypothetical protein
MKRIKHNSFLSFDDNENKQPFNFVDDLKLAENEGVITHSSFSLELFHLREIYNSGAMLNINQLSSGNILNMTTIKDSVEIVLEKKNDIITEDFRPDGMNIHAVTWSSNNSRIMDHSHKIEAWHYKKNGQNDKLLLKITDSQSHHHNGGLLNEIGFRHNGIIHIVSHD